MNVFRVFRDAVFVECLIRVAALKFCTILALFAFLKMLRLATRVGWMRVVRTPGDVDVSDGAPRGVAGGLPRVDEDAAVHDPAAGWGRNCLKHTRNREL